GSFASTSGTRVVLPAPGGATSTAVLRTRKAAVSSGSAASIGSGEAEVMARIVPTIIIAGLDPAIHRAVLPHGPLGQARGWRTRECAGRSYPPKRANSFQETI